jgi:alkylation response protein AidB-like acyl-CoA dehydrogenase
VTLCAGAGWFAGFLKPEFARAILDTPRLCVGGSGAPAGFADIEGDGYRLTGRWDFATGAPMTTHFTLNAVIRENGQPLLDERGNPRLRAFIVPAELVWVHETWRCTGLRATASHTFSMDHVWLGRQHAFDIVPGCATATGPLFRFPFLSLAFVTLAANVAGMAAGFIEMAEPVIARRRHPLLDRPLNELPQAHAALEQAKLTLAASRARFYDLLDTMWGQVCRDEPVPEAETHRLHLAAIALVDTARRAVDELYPFCGLHAADEQSDIGRVWRDLHTATQHKMLLPLP